MRLDSRTIALVLQAGNNTNQDVSKINQTGNNYRGYSISREDTIEESSFCNLKQPHECSDVRFTSVSKSKESKDSLMIETNGISSFMCLTAAKHRIDSLIKE